MPWLLPLLLALQAPPPLDEDPDFTRALELYDDLEFEQAIFALQEVALVEGRSDADRARVLVWLGISYGQIGDLDAAGRQFDLALAANPDLELPVTVPPKVDRLFGEARRKARTKAAARRPDPASAPPTTGGGGSTGTDASTDGPAPKTSPSTGAAPEPTEEGGLLSTSLLVAGGVGAAGALVALAAAGGLGGATWWLYSSSSDPAAKQAEAYQSWQLAHVALYAAVAAGAVGVLLLAGGAVGLGAGFVVE